MLINETDEAGRLNGRLTPSQWRLYDYLKRNCVSGANKKPGKVICSALGYSSTIELRQDMKALRCTMTRRIESSNAGYWLPKDEADTSGFVGAKALSHLGTAIKNGQLSIGQAYSFLNILKGSKEDCPLDNQIKLALGNGERTVVKVYSDDLLMDTKPYKEQLEYYRGLYLSLGGYPVLLTLDEYKKEIKTMEGKKDAGDAKGVRA